MIEVEFIYNSSNIIIQSNKSEKMKEIFKRFVEKTGNEINSIVFMSDENKIINEELTLEEIFNENDKLTNHINILVKPIKSSDQIFSNIKSKEVICPICGELSDIIIEDYKLNFNKCKNGHKINNLNVIEFEKSQEIGLSKIICDQCKINNKSKIFNNEFYKCNFCKINLCPSCKLNHDKNHNILNYEQKYYLCDKHNAKFTSYCKECNKSLCSSCAKFHNLADFNTVNPGIPLNHTIINFGKMPNKNDLKAKIKKIRERIDKFKKDTKEIIDILNKKHG